MALSLPTLTSQLVSVFDSMPPSASEAAQALANAYRAYAGAGQFGLSLPVPATLDLKRDAMKSTLQAAIANPLIGTPANFAGAWASSVAAFWTAVPVAGGAGAGTTSGAPGASSLTGTLSAVFANVLNTSATCAASLAGALHTATLTVTAAMPSGPVNIA